MRSERSRLAALSSLVVLLGCNVYDPAFLNRLDGGPRRDGGDAGEERDAGEGTDAGPDDAGPDDAGPVDSGPVACGRRIPDRPAVGAGDGPEVVFAFRDIIVDQTSDPLWSDLGFDLDGECTEAGITEFLCAPFGAAGPPLDGPRGVDNIVGQRIFPQISMFDMDFQESSASGMERGNTFLVRIRGWNGEDDDAQVEATFAQGTGSEGLTRMDGNPEPQWDGMDEWDVSRINFAAGNPNSPLVSDDNAYVVGRRLVFRIPERESIRLPFTGPNDLVIRLTDGWITGLISEDGTRMNTTVLTGRWSALDIADAIEAVGLCATSGERVAFDSLIANQVDVRSDQATSGGLRCDALSMAIAFTGYRALWGNVVEPPPEPPEPCP